MLDSWLPNQKRPRFSIGGAHRAVVEHQTSKPHGRATALVEPTPRGDSQPVMISQIDKVTQVSGTATALLRRSWTKHRVVIVAAGHSGQRNVAD